MKWLIVAMLLTAGALWWALGFAAIPPMPTERLPSTPDAAGSLQGGVASTATAQDGAGARHALPQQLRILDARTQRPIQGARVEVVGAADVVVARLRTGADGAVTVPADPGLRGFAVAADGYQSAAAEPGATEIALPRQPAISVRLTGVGARVAADYDLEASLEYGEQRQPLEYVRRQLGAHQPHVSVTGGSGEFPRVLPAGCTIRLHGIHKDTGKRTEFAKIQLGPEESVATFDCSRFRVPTGHWLLLEVRPPRPVARPVHLSVALEYQDGTRWGSWRSYHLSCDPEREWMRFPFIELWNHKYRVEVEIDDGAQGQGRVRIPPFLVNGGVKKRIDLRQRGRASLTVRVNDPEFHMGRIVLDGPAGAPPGLARVLGPGLVRFENLEPGEYQVRPVDWARFTPTKVKVAARQPAGVNLALQPVGLLFLDHLDADAKFTVRDVHRRRQVPAHIFGFGRWHRHPSHCATVPQGTYSVEVQGRNPMQVAVASGSNHLDCKTGSVASK